jgi:hypothetical protein
MLVSDEGSNGVEQVKIATRGYRPMNPKSTGRWH